MAQDGKVAGYKDNSIHAKSQRNEQECIRSSCMPRTEDSFIFSILGMLGLACWNFGLGVEQVMELLPGRSYAFLLILMALAMYAVVFVACYLPILRHWRELLTYPSSMVGETSLLPLKFLVSLLLQAVWLVVEDTKDKLYLPLIMLIAFSIIIIVKVEIFLRHDEMKILEEVAGSFLRFMVEAVGVKNYVGACLCICPTVIAIIAVLSPPLDADEVLGRFFKSVYESIGGYFTATRIQTDGAATRDGGSKILPCTCGWGD
ncbi:unnamed protein product [Camellia sinensis]